MLTYIAAIILGLVEGVTEFVPVSSTGHLILAGHALGFVGPRPAARIETVPQIDYRTALWIGIAQVCSLIPGVSRSGATIMGALLAGVGRPAAAEFSFLLAIPVMLAATGLDLWENRHLLSGSDALIFAVGFVVAFASALVVVRWLVRFVSH